MDLLKGKTGVIFGLANKRSIAWGIAQALSAAGMRLAFTYQGERLREMVAPLIETIPDSLMIPCDVSNDADIDSVFSTIADEFGSLDCLVHSVAYAPKDDLGNGFLDISREGWRVAQDISAYSLIALSRAAVPLMEKTGTGSIIALSYYGAEKVVDGYDLMGVAKAALEANVRYLASSIGPRNIRVNAISAGPVNTLAARGIKGFTEMLKQHASRAPLRRNVELREVGDAAVFLASSMASGITGEVMYVDCGYNVMGV